MRNLLSSDLLSIWEQGFPLHPLDRGLIVLAAAMPEISFESLADWPVGRRNIAIAAVRCACFGSSLQGWSACAACGEKLEFDVEGDLLAEGAYSPSFHVPPKPLTFNDCRFRLPTTRDLASILHASDASEAAMRLIQNCRLDTKQATPLTEEEREAVQASMAEADPMADIRLEMLCPTCGHEGEAALDVLAFFWAEAETFVKRLLTDVHHLASAYGWSESHILSLSDHRRTLYLDRVLA